ncbi:MAG: ImmA/IrrE family metallo-endopeptidase [bacterium]|nr:ImmA/IrrE family metallo-endopeptidase [bacterium]
MPDDFDEISGVLDKLVEELLAKCGIDRPPIEPKKIADALGLVYDETELEGRRGQSYRRYGRQHVEIHRKDRPERKNFALAHEIMELELKKVLDDPRESHRWANLGASFLLMPTPWFRDQCIQTGFDLAKLKKVFTTASWEVIALRTLNFSESIITIVDDDRVTRRKSSYPFYVSKRLSDEEKHVVLDVLQTKKVQRQHFPSCEVTGYPVFEKGHKRVILRTTLDETGYVRDSSETPEGQVRSNGE